jgi:hypothetical protein
LSGCGDSKQKTEEKTRIQSFTNNLAKADVKYAMSIVYTMSLMQKAVEAAQSSEVTQEILQHQSSYDAAKDYLQNYAHFDISTTNGQAAFDLVVREDDDFQYIYTHEKKLPSSFKDDFHNIRDVLSKNLDFISSLKDGNIDKESVQNWNDSPKSLNNSYHNLLLELDRLQK